MDEVLVAWLHVSDIHAEHGNAEHRANQQWIFKDLEADIPRAIDAGAPQPRMIFVTGDIAFSGGAVVRKPGEPNTEYQTAAKLLASLAGSLGILPGSVYIVPGNHDVRRISRQSVALAAIEGMRRGAPAIDDALAIEDYQEVLQARLRGYYEFCATQNSTCASLTSWSQVRTEGGVPLRIVGLNTALLCNDNEDQGKLYLGQSQLGPLRDAKPGEIVVVLTHHPLAEGWLADEEVVGDMVCQRAHVHLCGHVHAARSADSRSGGSRRVATIVAGATHEDRKPRDTPYSHGYNIAALVRAPSGELLVRVWPRRWFSGKGFILDAKGVDEPRRHADHPLDIRIEAAKPEPVRAAAESAADAEILRNESRFRGLVAARYSRIEVSMPMAEPLELPLESIYVELKLIEMVPPGADAFSVDERRVLEELDGTRDCGERERLLSQFEGYNYDRWRSLGGVRREGSTVKPSTVFELLRAESTARAILVLGDPGSGKSTLLQTLALRAARGEPLGPPTAGAAPMLPILIRLAAYDAHLTQLVRNGQGMTNLREFLAVYWSNWEHFPNGASLFQQAFDTGRAFVLLDGLDEVMDLERRMFVAGQIDALIRTAAPGNRFVVTSRIIGYRQAPLSVDHTRVTVLDFTRKEIELFLAQWNEALEARITNTATVETHRRAVAQGEAMLAELTANPQLLELAKNPLQLGMLALLRKHGPLPQNRVEVFDQFTRMLLEIRPAQRSKGARTEPISKHRPNELRGCLQQLALWLHQHHPSRTARRRDMLLKLQAIVLPTIARDPERPTPFETEQAEREAESRFDALRNIVGMVIDRGDDSIGFAHLTYQEFFAARELARLPAEQRFKEILAPVLHVARWKEVLKLCVAGLSLLDNEIAAADRLIIEVLTANSEFEELLCRDVFLAADLAANRFTLSRSVLDRIIDALESCMASPYAHLRQHAQNSFAQLARAGYPVCVERLVTRLEQLRRSMPPDFQIVLQQLVRPVVGEPSCRPVRDLLLGWIDEAIQSQAADLSRGYGDTWVLISCIQSQIFADSALRAKFYPLFDALGAWHMIMFQINGDQILEDPGIYARLLDLANAVPPSQPALMKLATHCDTEEVRSLLFAHRDNPDSSIANTVQAAARRFARTDPGWRQWLFARLDGSDVVARVQSIPTLGKLAEDDADLAARLIRMLDSDDAEVVIEAIKVIPRSVPRSEVQQRLIALVRDQDAMLRTQAMSALAPVVTASPVAVRAIRDNLEDPVMSVRMTALRVLAPLAMTDTELADSLRTHLKNDRYSERAEMAAAVAPMVALDEEIRVCMMALMEHSDVTVRIAAIEALATLGAEGPVHKRLIKMLSTGGALLKAAAVNALSGRVSSSPEVLEAFVRIASESPNSEAGSAAAEALAPRYQESGIASILLARLSNGIYVGPLSRSAIVEMARADPGVMAQLRDILSSVRSRSWPDGHHIMDALSVLLATDEGIRAGFFGLIGSPAGFNAFCMLARHPEITEVQALLNRCLLGDAHESVRSRAAFALMRHAHRHRDPEARLSDLLKILPPEIPVDMGDFIDNDEIRRLLLESTRTTVPASAFGSPRGRALKELASGVSRHGDIEFRFREILSEKVPEGSNEHWVQELSLVAHSLGSLVARDPALVEKLLPWLGVRSPPNVKQASERRRGLATAIGRMAGRISGLRDRLVEMLDSSAWQERQGAAWALMAMEGGRDDPGLRSRLRALIDDERGDESWKERLQAADALINNADPKLSRLAVQVALEGLRYGYAPWYEPLGSEIRAAAAEVLGRWQPTRRDEALLEQVAQALRSERSQSVQRSLHGALHGLASASPPRVAR